MPVAEAFLAAVGIAAYTVGLWFHDWRSLAAALVCLFAAFVCEDLFRIDATLSEHTRRRRR